MNEILEELRAALERQPDSDPAANARLIVAYMRLFDAEVRVAKRRARRAAVRRSTIPGRARARRSRRRPWKG